MMAVVKRSREAVQSSAFACELRAADSPRPLAFISNLCHLGSGMVRARLAKSCNRKEVSGTTQALSRTAVRVASLIVNFAASLTEDMSRHESLHCFQSSSCPQCWKQLARP